MEDVPNKSMHVVHVEEGEIFFLLLLGWPDAWFIPPTEPAARISGSSSLMSVAFNLSMSFNQASYLHPHSSAYLLGCSSPIKILAYPQPPFASIHAFLLLFSSYS